MCLDDIADLGTDSTPNGVEWNVEDAMDRLDGDLAVFAGGLSEWCGVVVGTVNEFRAVATPSNAVIIKLLFVGGGTMLRSNGGVAGEGEGGHIRRYRRLVNSRGTGQGE